MSLYEQTAAHKVKAEGMLGEKFGILADAIEDVRSSGLANRAKAVGTVAPDFSLLDAFGSSVSLRELLAVGPIVLSFYRGEWCPFCNFELHALQEVLPQIQALGATLVAVSPEKPDFGAIATEKHKLTFPVLSDAGNQVARQYGLVYQVSEDQKTMSLNMFQLDIAARNADGSWELPIPATFVIDPNSTIRFAHVDPDYMLGRADPQSILAALRESGQISKS